MGRLRVIELHNGTEAREVEIELHEPEATQVTEQHEGSTKVGTKGLSYGTEAAEEMIAGRIKKLEEKGAYPGYGERAMRGVAVGQLAQEGNLRTLEDVSTEKPVYLADRERAERRRDAQQEQDDLRAAKVEARERGITLSEVMNEKAQRGEVRGL